jgi:pyruvate/2-oxoglutarate dehydrogenase complex dihydrolipoamide acyltransferase (E2) component
LGRNISIDSVSVIGEWITFLMKTTLSVDHRVADGAQAGRFMQEFKKLLENPVTLLTV